MRWFFFLLLAINTIFFLSQKSGTPAQGALPLSVGEGQNNISLLSEVREDGSPAVRGAEEGAAAEGIKVDAVATSEDSLCLLLGPYKSADALRAESDLVSGAKLLIETYERSADFWVYLGPYSSFDAAAKVGAELRTKRIDNFIIRAGNLKNAISLGVFTTEERAAIHAKGLRKKAYDVAVKRVAKEGERYWMAFAAPEGASSYLDAERVMGKNTDNNKRLEKKSCNLIASYQELD